MIDKSLVKRRFKKSLAKYEENAVIQKIMAEKLIKILPSGEYNSILEIGCATGLLTRILKKNIRFNHYSVIDIVAEAQDYIKQIIPNAEFTEGDIEEITINNKYDLIISNACLQWCNNPEKVIEKLKKSLNKGGIIAITLFGEENLKELKEYFKLESPVLFKPNNVIFHDEEKIKIYFNSPLDILKHLKQTGANALKDYKLTRTMLSDFEKYYQKHYNEGEKVYITYNPEYLILN